MFNTVNLIVFFNKYDRYSNLARRDCRKIKEYELHWQLEVELKGCVYSAV